MLTFWVVNAGVDVFETGESESEGGHNEETEEGVERWVTVLDNDTGMRRGTCAFSIF